MHTEKFHLGYRPELDGLRSIAVFLVMLVHSGLALTVGGAIGVDTFFVLSGFLITYLLSSEFTRTDHISLKNFYIRRFLRLTPALFLMLFAYGIYSLITKRGDDLAHAGNVILIIAVYLADIAKAFGYSNLDMIAHTWSLAIEEHFYLLFPPILYFLLKKGFARPHICYGLLVIAGLVAVYRLWAVLPGDNHFDINRIYFGFDYHFDGLLIGCALALIVERGEDYLPKIPRIVTFAAVIFLTVCFLFVSNSTSLYFILLSLINLSACLILIHLLRFGNFLLRQPILVWVGKISYGLYLWHSFIYEALRAQFHLGSVPILIFGGAASFAAAALSYYFLEKPALKLKARFHS